MKALSVIKYIFSISGILLLLGAVYSYRNTADFLDIAVPTTGTVVDFVTVSSDSITYKPVIRFVTDSNEEVEFTSSVSSNPPAYALDEKVEVLYSPLNAHQAEINNLAELWWAFITMLVLGGVFLSVGMLIFSIGKLRRRKNAYLIRHGVAVEAEFQSVERNYSLSINGKNPFVIVCHWLNTETSEIHVFESDNIWFDPSRYINREMLKVFIKRGNPKKYHVDISFLPKLKS